MMYWRKERGKKYWIKRAIFIPIAIAAGVFIFGGVVMLLWNGILPAVLGVSTITYWQAVGILVLSKILFGAFKGHHRNSRCHSDRHIWRKKWMNMSPEEKEKMKAEWKNRCESSKKHE